MDFKQIYASDRQTLVDIAMQEYGCYDGIFLLLQDNADRLSEISEIPVPGMKLNIQTPVPEINNTNRLIAEYYADNKIRVVTNAEQVSTTPSWQQGYVQGNYIQPTLTGYISPPLHLQLTAILSNLTYIHD